MKILRYALVGAVAAATLASGASAASAATHTATSPAAAKSSCSAGNVHGTYRHGLTIRGTCTIGKKAHVIVVGRLRLAPGATLAVADGAHLTVRGRVRLGHGSQFNGITASTVRLKGNVMVGPGAKFAFGCSKALTQPDPPAPTICPNGVSHDRIDGNLDAWRALVLQIDGVTINGNVTSIGGGMVVTDPGCVQKPGALNFAFKDNTVNGQILVSGWRGCWIGFIRNVQHGNMFIMGNTGEATTTFPPSTTLVPDAMEVVTNHIWGSLACYGNTPSARKGDSGGAKNVVTGLKLGECASL